MALARTAASARRILLASASVGALAWAGYSLHAGVFALDALFLAAPLAIVPAALALALRDTRAGVLARADRAAALAQPAAAALLLLAFLLPAGPAAGALAAPWLAFTILLAARGAARLLARGAGPAEELAIDAGHVYAAVGGAWALASRAGIEPLGFGEPLVILTAVHFHVAGFALLLLAGAIGRATMPSRSERAYVAIVAALVAGPFLLALGITFSRAVEIAAAVVMAVATIGLLAFAAGWRRRFHLVALPALASMTLAILFATRGVPIPTMARYHGALNLALVGAALAMMHFLRADGRTPLAGIPFSRLRSRGTTAPSFFEREKLAVRREPRPTGLVDEMVSYARPDFDPAKLAPAIRAFYERTEDHALLVTPRWRRGFRALGHVYGRYARRAGQMRFPMGGTTGAEPIRSVILAVDDARDGRTNVRAWVRTYAATGDPVYVAAYSTHEWRGETYMNIAFPFPGWNLTSILRLEELREGGVRLTSLPAPARWGDQGVYAVGAWWRLRMPINETIDVWTDDGATVLARHDMWFLGIRFLTLDYQIRPGEISPRTVRPRDQ